MSSFVAKVLGRSVPALSGGVLRSGGLAPFAVNLPPRPLSRLGPSGDNAIQGSVILLSFGS